MKLFRSAMYQVLRTWFYHFPLAFAIGVIVLSTLLNTGYFIPVIYNAFFKEADDKDDPHANHGEAPLPMVIALTATAIATVLLFFFSGLPLELATQVVGK